MEHSPFRFLQCIAECNPIDSTQSAYNPCVARVPLPCPFFRSIPDFHFLNWWKLTVDRVVDPNNNQENAVHSSPCNRVECDNHRASYRLFVIRVVLFPLSAKTVRKYSDSWTIEPPWFHRSCQIALVRPIYANTNSNLNKRSSTRRYTHTRWIVWDVTVPNMGSWPVSFICAILCANISWTNKGLSILVLNKMQLNLCCKLEKYLVPLLKQPLNLNFQLTKPHSIHQ